MKLVQMPTNLLHIEEADLSVAGYDAGLLAGVRSYLPELAADRRGAAILTPAGRGGRQVLMLIARRVGAALRDENIAVRDGGGDMTVRKKRLCYLPGQLLGGALDLAAARTALASEAACFLQDLEAAAVPPDAVLALLDRRLGAGLPTFVNADPTGLAPTLVTGLRARLRVLEPAAGR